MYNFKIMFRTTKNQNTQIIYLLPVNFAFCRYVVSTLNPRYDLFSVHVEGRLRVEGFRIPKQMQCYAIFPSDFSSNNSQHGRLAR